MKKKDIVKTQQEFNNIINTGNKVCNKAFVIYYRNNNVKHSRYGISVGTKLGNAVFRNKYKRRIRMIITNNNELLYGNKNDYIVILRKGAVNLEYSDLEKSFIYLANKLKEN